MTTRSVVRCSFHLLALAAIVTAGEIRPAAAQSTSTARRELVGRVRDSTHAAVPAAIVEAAGMQTRTDSAGRFRLSTPNIDTLSLAVRRLGFAPETVQLRARHGQWDTVVVELSQTAQVLDPVYSRDNVPTRMRGFEERRARGVGVFVTRQQIAEYNTTLPSDVLRTKRGIRVMRSRYGTVVRFSQFQSKPNCQPAIWIDGQRARGMEIDEISAGDIEGIELYDSFSITPFEFSRDADIPCGTIVVWTRVPGK